MHSTNIHIYPSNMKNESRIFKEAKSIEKLNFFDEIILLGIHEEGLPNEWNLSDKIKVKLVKTYGVKNRLFQYMSLYFTLFRLMLIKKPKLVNLHNVELLPFSYIAKRIFKSYVVYDTHELETERAHLAGKRQSIYKKIEKRFIGYCDTVIVVGEAIAEFYIAQYPQIEKPIVVLNAPLYKDSIKKDIFRETLGIEKEKTIFLYQGVLGSGRSIEVLVEAFKKIDTNCVIVFMGYGPFENMLKKSSVKHSNIYFHKAVKPDILFQYTASADFGISMIEDICLSYHLCMPNKLFEYIMAEVPVIVSSLPEMRRIVLDNHVGVIVEHNSVDSLKEAIKEAIKLNKDQTKLNLQKLKKVYNWERQEKILLEAYKGLFT